MKLRNAKKKLKKIALKRYTIPIDINKTYCKITYSNKIFPNGKRMLVLRLLSKKNDKAYGLKYFYIKSKNY